MKSRAMRLLPLLFVVLSLVLPICSTHTDRRTPPDSWGIFDTEKDAATETFEKASALLQKVQPPAAPWWSFKKSGVFGTSAYYAKELFFLLFTNGPPQQELLTTSTRPKMLAHPLADAVKLLEEAAAASNPDALFTLAEMNFYGNYSHPRNYTEAFHRYYELATLNGNTSAQHMLGFMYATGIGGAVKQDQARAMLYHTLAADGGDVRSEMTVAFRHASGISTPRNCERAVHYYKRAADRAIEYMRAGPPGGTALVRESYRIADEDGGVYGDGASVTSSGPNAKHVNVYSDGALDDMVEYMYVQARKGDLGASFSLAKLNYDGARSSRRNFDQARKRFIEIARLYWTKDGKVRPNVGDKVEKYASKAAGYLGRMALRAEGIEQNFPLAKLWFTRGIKNGDALSQYSLGLMYLNGYGVDKNPVKAADFFKAAADQGLAVAQVRIGALFLDQGDVSVAIKYFELASRSGHLEAYYYLAELTHAGVGRDKSCLVASAHYKIVAEKAEGYTTSFLEANKAYNDGDLETALVGYMMAAEQGFEVGQANVAYLLDQAKPRSSFGSLVPFTKRKTPLASDARLALLYWTRSSEQRNIDSMVKLGDYYLQGLGTEPDPEKAAACYTAAAEDLVSAQALWNLGWMHENGIGIEQDFHLAKRHYDLALETNPVEAKLPVLLALYKLRFRSWWNTVTHGNIKSIQEEPVVKKEWSFSEWIAAFIEAELGPRDIDVDPEGEDYDTHMPGMDGDYGYDDLDSDILESLIMLGLTGALAFLLYYRGQRQRRAEEERRRQELQQQPAQPQAQVPPQNQQQDRGMFPHPNDPEFMNWAAGGVGH